MLDIKNLSFGFGDHVLYNELNIQFLPGEITGIMGANGVGKTTLFRIISSMYKTNFGDIFYCNRKALSTDVAIMPTEPFFYPYMKGMEYLKIVSSSVEEMSLSCRYADIFELPLNNLVDNYSTGMKKKLAFSAIFSLTKPIIILDEPFNGVDLMGNEIIKKLIISESGERVVILSSHILTTLTDISDAIYHFEGKSKVSKFKSDEFYLLEGKIKAEVDMTI